MFSRRTAVVAGTLAVLGAAGYGAYWLLSKRACLWAGNGHRCDHGPRRGVSCIAAGRARRHYDSTSTGVPEFDNATKVLQTDVGSSLTTEQKLQLYGLYKIATAGPCTRAQPSRADLQGYYKWKAWKQYTDEHWADDEARARYVELVDEWVPGWRSHVSSETPSRNSGTGMGVAVSTFQAQTAEEEANAIAQDHSAFRLLDGRGSQTLRDELENGLDPNSRNRVGETLLHVASDGGRVGAMEHLIRHGADVNATEPENNETPLMYAALSGGLAAVECLLRAGAEKTMCNKDGETALDLCGDESAANALQRHA